MGTTAEKINYAINATNDIAEGINNIGGNITQNTELADFREELDNIYNELPKVTGEGSSFSLLNTRKGRMITIPEGNCKQESLPDGYTALTYIESTGEQYIDTGYISNYNTRVELKFQITSIPDKSMYILGSSTSYTRGFNLSFDPTNHTSTSFRNTFGNVLRATNIIPEVNTIYNISIDKTEIDINNNKTQIAGGTTNFYNGNLFLFTDNRNGTAFTNYSFIGKLYKCKIYNNDILIREFIPCKNSNNEIGLYDLVTKTFYGNQGTGTFIAGDETSFPNPEYPQDIKVVTGKNKVVYKGINYFNHYDYPASQTKNGVTITNNGDGSFTLNGTCTTNNTFFQIGLDSIVKNLAQNNNITHTLYYVSGKNTKSSSSNARNVLRLNYNNLLSMIPLQELESSKIISKTLPKTSRSDGWSWTIVLDTGDSFDNFTVKYQLNIGDTALPYEPYIEPKEFDLDLTSKNKWSSEMEEGRN